jgi:hypothetical protein
MLAGDVLIFLAGQVGPSDRLSVLVSGCFGIYSGVLRSAADDHGCCSLPPPLCLPSQCLANIILAAYTYSHDSITAPTASSEYVLSKAPHWVQVTHGAFKWRQPESRRAVLSRARPFPVKKSSRPW